MYVYNEYKNITAITSTREGGKSNEGYSSLNLAYQVGDDPLIVAENRELFFDNPQVKINAKNSVFVHQSHSDITYKVTKKDVGKGFSSFESGIPADALYTKDQGIALAIYHADCVPIFIYVPNHNIVGIIHAGEKGSVNNITSKFVHTLINDEKVKPHKIFAHIGPSLTFAHRLITKERAHELARMGGDIQKAVKGTLPLYFLDLPLLNTLQLRSMGVPLDNITFSEECTYENNDRYFSYAKEKVTGRNISFIRLDKLV